jgi:hypothetical protein
MNDYELEMDYAEQCTLAAARDFLNRQPDWNMDQAIEETCNHINFDYEFVWFASRVLFESAVYNQLTGKVM